MSHGTSLLDGFIGPCVHGRDPYDRCEGCGQLTPVQAEAVARAEMFLPLTRERARAVLAEYLTRADTPDALRLAICRVNDGPDECADALADLLVDAAAGRVR